MWTAKMARQCGTGKLWDSTPPERGLADLTWGVGNDVDTIKRAHVGPLFPFEEAVELKDGDLVFTLDGDPCRLSADTSPENGGEPRFCVEHLHNGSIDSYSMSESSILERFNPWPGFANEFAKRTPQYMA